MVVIVADGISRAVQSHGGLMAPCGVVNEVCLVRSVGGGVEPRDGCGVVVFVADGISRAVQSHGGLMAPGTRVFRRFRVC